MGTDPGRDEAGVVIIGGGQSGLQTADSLRAEGYTGPVTIVAEETHPPYQRPPLSKDYLAAGDTAPSPLPLRGPGYLDGLDVTLLAGTRAVAIDRVARTVTVRHLDAGDGDERTLPWTHLVLATGARNRQLACPGADLSGVHGLRTLADAQRLHAALSTARDIVVVGAGFIGLEFAAAARARGAGVTVLEFAPRVMGRAVTAATGTWVSDAHTADGIDIRLGEGIVGFEVGPEGTLTAAVSTTGSRYPADLAVVGVGVLPETRLAAAAGLTVDNGIVVDGALRTSDPAILAVGDCASFPSAHAGTGPGETHHLRLESVQNATDQARHAAATITGRLADYAELPWFWSTQGRIKLQMAGIARPDDATVVTGDRVAGRFSVLCFRDGALVAVESVNQPGDHLAARRIIAAGLGPTAEEAGEPGFSLKAWARTAAVRATA